MKQFFITFPKSNVDKVTFRDALLRFEPDFYKVVEEKHKDGTPHLHAVIRFKNKYSKSKILSYFKELYPDDYKRIDIESVRSISNAITYLSKEDPNPLTTGEYKDNRNPPRNLINTFIRELGYTSLEDLQTQAHTEHLQLHAWQSALWAYFSDLAWINSTYVDFEINASDLEYHFVQKVRRIMFDEFIPFNNQLKDDMTFIFKQLNINL